MPKNGNDLEDIDVTTGRSVSTGTKRPKVSALPKPPASKTGSGKSGGSKPKAAPKAPKISAPAAKGMSARGGKASPPKNLFKAATPPRTKAQGMPYKLKRG